jgi:hypothetical protein
MTLEDKKQTKEVEITPEMIEVGVSVCLHYGVENVAFLDRFASDLYREMAASARKQTSPPDLSLVG